jgi:protein-L-isoaspartate O-methyltransferase
VAHVGAGLGYYSAILAEVVGSTGEVTAIEIDPGLAERASEPRPLLAAGEGHRRRRLRFSSR